MLGFVFDALDDGSGSQFLDDFDELGQHAAHFGVMFGLVDDAEDELDVVRRNLPQAIQIGVLDAKVIDGDVVAAIAVVVDGFTQLLVGVDGAFQNFNYDFVRGYRVGMQDALEHLAVGVYADQKFGVHVKKQQAASVGKMQVVKRMQRSGNTVELDQAPLVVGKTEGEGRG